MMAPMTWIWISDSIQSITSSFWMFMVVIWSVFKRSSIQYLNSVRNTIRLRNQTCFDHFELSDPTVFNFLFLCFSTPKTFRRFDGRMTAPRPFPHPPHLSNSSLYNNNSSSSNNNSYLYFSTIDQDWNAARRAVTSQTGTSPMPNRPTTTPWHQLYVERTPPWSTCWPNLYPRLCQYLHQFLPSGTKSPRKNYQKTPWESSFLHIRQTGLPWQQRLHQGPRILPVTNSSSSRSLTTFCYRQYLKIFRPLFLSLRVLRWDLLKMMTFSPRYWTVWLSFRRRVRLQGLLIQWEETSFILKIRFPASKNIWPAQRERF